jgi:hypothetical protein
VAAEGAQDAGPADVYPTDKDLARERRARDRLAPLARLCELLEHQKHEYYNAQVRHWHWHWL